MFDLKFPGYGLTSLGDQPQPDGSIITLFAVEIPRAGKDRYIAFHRHADGFRLADDFVAPADPEISSVRGELGFLIYTDREGDRIFKRPLVEARAQK